MEKRGETDMQKSSRDIRTEIQTKILFCACSVYYISVASSKIKVRELNIGNFDPWKLWTYLLFKILHVKAKGLQHLYLYFKKKGATEKP